MGSLLPPPMVSQHGIPWLGAQDREALVLLSGMLGDATLWDGVVDGLVDLVRPWPARTDLDDSVPEMAASVLAQAPARFAVMGHSLGAIVAMEILRRAPDRVSRLVLVNASARGPTPAQQRAWQGWDARTAAGGFDSVVAELAIATLAPERRGDPVLLARNEAMGFIVGPAGLRRQLSAQMTRPEGLSGLAAITVPVLVVSGDRDHICAPELQHEIAASCRQAELVTVAGAGHMLPMEHPHDLVVALRSWLGGDGGVAGHEVTSRADHAGGPVSRGHA